MKKSILRLVVVALASMSLAQSSYADNHLRWGVFGGLAFMTQDFEATSGSIASDSNVGFAVGGNIEWMVMEYFYVQPELMYIRKGSEFQGRDGFNQAITVQADVDYAEVPILAKGKYGFDMFDLYATFGPYFSFKVNESKSAAVANVIATSATANFSSFDFGLVFGGGAAFDIGDGMDLYVDIRYDYGLTDINDDAVSTVEVQNRGWLFSVGMSFMM